MMLTKSKRASGTGQGKRPEDRSLAELLQDGVVVIDKPSGPTSHQVTSWAADIMGVSKAAHGGTLDPRVTGVLPVGVGNAVRAMDALHYGTKAYVGVMRMHGNVDPKRLMEVFSEFTGEIFQTPPMRSAVKREMRTRRVEALRLLEVSGRDVLFDVECEAGTYIRSLCVDMGDALATGAHLQDLRRTRAGALTEADAVSLHDLKDAFEEHKTGNDQLLRSMLRPKEVLVAQIPKVEVKDSAVDAICHGASLAVPGVVAIDEQIRKGDPVAVMTMSGEGVGLGTAMMDAQEVLKRSDGFAVEVSRVLMQRGTYKAAWKSAT
ncbi:MAG: RNA-guided pseudouridylation complex pseudouridine synthase subunit Cbf5 [Thermoplasmata archaeon]|jgi:H/ACA ribonucleoprotein complex subunit 4|nr:RNA-guided pseudouridylation complex pseudouridine synthase subunit Cbf5 [Thermoplasmata archaeon]